MGAPQNNGMVGKEKNPVFRVCQIELVLNPDVPYPYCIPNILPMIFPPFDLKKWW